MFTGIIEALGTIVNITTEGTNKNFEVESSISNELKVDQSLSHNGVCLTVTSVKANTHFVTAVEESLNKSNLGLLKKGDNVNLERSMLMNGRLDGHIVQGHVDKTGVCTGVEEKDGSWLFHFEFEDDAEHFLVEKGSVSINGVSLTCFNVTNKSFTVAIIPYTFHHTNFHSIKKGDTINLEFDIIGKYIKKLTLVYRQ